MLRAAVTAVAWSSVGYRLVLLRFTASPPNRTLLAIVAFPAVAATALARPGPGPGATGTAATGAKATAATTTA